MKNIPHLFSRTRNKRGFALIIILSVIVLLLALVVGFFSRVQGELQSSSTYQSAGTARNLSDYAVNLVLTQIKAGTAGKDSGGTLTTWASQPGAIRTFDTSGNLKSVYKLYSSQAMLASSINVASEAQALNTWTTDKALFTDLNEPLNNQFPILDPGALNTVQGYSVTGGPPGITATTIPMPARWLYILKDGQVVSPTGGGLTASIAGASVVNPIVGRIAFWTDDDTSKININTAGGGAWEEPNIDVTYQYGNSAASFLRYSGPAFTSYWSTPIAFSRQDGILAGNQPVKREYQRYPGHPANTFLTAALPALDAEQVYSLTSRLQNQGSKGGSVLSTNPVNLDTERLYQSVDELLFKPDRNSLNLGIDKAALEKAKFFLTANSRSPDVNPFNEPRVSMWPINQAVAKRTPYDKLIAFCETINNFPYYFLRQSADSSSADISINRNSQILEYLRRRTNDAIPGFGGAGVLGKYGTTERNQILTELFDYIRSTNTKDSSMATSAGAVDSNYFYSASGAVVPSYDASTGSRGFGRFPTLSKVGIVIYGVAQNKTGQDNKHTDGNDRDEIGPPEDNVAIPPVDGTRRMRALLLFELFNPAQGYGKVFPRLELNVDLGTTGFVWKAGGPSMFRARTAKFPYYTDADWNYGVFSTPWGGRIGVKTVMGPFSRNNDATTYPFMGGVGFESDDVDPTVPFDFYGGTATVRITGPGGTPVYQVCTVVFPGDAAAPVKFPVPELAPLVLADTDNAATRDFRKSEQRLNVRSAQNWNSWITSKDVVRSVGVASGDYRIVAGQFQPNFTLYTAHPYYSRLDKPLAHNFIETFPVPYHGGTFGTYVPMSQANYARGGNRDTTYPGEELVTYIGSDTSMGIVSSSNSHLVDSYSTKGVFVGGGLAGVPGDWDNAVGRYNDGPYINFPDEGSIQTGVTTGETIPYFGFIEDFTELGPSFFTPNRMMPSSVMFGSLSTGVRSNSPWQTLLFHPQSGHPGERNPPDYLLLDFFNMPVVEPYAISEPLSTAGRVNMNYQILPYSYIERSTAVRAVLRSERVMGILNSDANRFKNQTTNANAINSTRYMLNLDKDSGTLKGFETRFAANDIFRSPGEICSLWLVPVGETYAGMSGWWNAHLPTGDNSKEAPYSRIYPRLTTKSNTYTVHYRVQTLKKPKNATNQGQWQEGADKVQAEYRGSTTIERYIDPNDPNIPDYITTPNPPLLDTFYKFRVLSQKQFNP